MTVQSLLDMTSGIEWVEKSYTPDETIMRMYKSPDRTAFVLNQPMAGRRGPNSTTMAAIPICCPR